MRAVALSDAVVQEKLAKSFVTLKVPVPQGTKEIPTVGRWPALRYWAATYRFLGGEKCAGWYAVSAISPDLQTEYAQPGSGLPWQLFDSPSYDATKFAAMLDRAIDRAAKERAIRTDATLTLQERNRRLTIFRAEVHAALKKETDVPVLPPKNFSLESAQKLYKMAGEDLFAPGPPVVK